MLKHFIKIVLNRPSGALISGNDKDLPTGLFLWVVFVLLGLWLVIGYLHIQIINKREPLFIHIKKRLRGYIICVLCRFKLYLILPIYALSPATPSLLFYYLLWNE